MARPYVRFAEVKKIPLPEVMAKAGVDLTAFKQKGTTYTGSCPMPNHPESPLPHDREFRIDCKDGLWLYHCFDEKCPAKGGDQVSFIKEYCGYDDSNARLWFAREFPDRLNLAKPKPNGTRKKPPGKKRRDPPKKATADPVETSRQADSTKPAANTFQPSILSNYAPARKLKPLRFSLRLEESPYLAERGVLPETIERFGLGHCPKDGKKKKQLEGYTVFPVTLPIDGKWETVCYFGRFPGEEFTEDRPKYKWPGEGIEEHVVFGLQQALEDSDSPCLILVQSPFDLFHCRQNGFPNVVALSRPKLTDGQAKLLLATNKHLVLFFHTTEVGLTGAKMAAAKLITQRFTRVLKLPHGHQPEHLVRHELRNAINTFSK